MIGLNHLICELRHTDDSLSAREAWHIKRDNKPQLAFRASSVEHRPFDQMLPLFLFALIIPLFLFIRYVEDCLKKEIQSKKGRNLLKGNNAEIIF